MMEDQASEVLQEDLGGKILHNFQVNCSPHCTGEQGTSGLSRFLSFIFEVKGPKSYTPVTENGEENIFIL